MSELSDTGNENSRSENRSWNHHHGDTHLIQRWAAQHHHIHNLQFTCFAEAHYVTLPFLRQHYSNIQGMRKVKPRSYLRWLVCNIANPEEAISRPWSFSQRELMLAEPYLAVSMSLSYRSWLRYRLGPDNARLEELVWVIQVLSVYTSIPYI